MRTLLIAAMLGGAALVLTPAGPVHAKGHPHRAAAAHPHAAAHAGPVHAAASGSHGFAHPGFAGRSDWDRHAEWRHHHSRLPYIVFGVLSTLLPPR